MPRLAILLLLACWVLTAGPAADLARAIREDGPDPNECYRVRDLTIIKEDLRIYLTDGHLIFSKPVAGRRIAAAFTADVEGGDGEVLLLPPSRAERQSLGSYTGSPNLDEHFKTAVFFFTGDVYNALMAQMPANPANRKAPEAAALLSDEWSPILRNLEAGYQTRLTLDLLNAPVRKPNLLAAFISGNKLGNFDVAFDPDRPEQIFVGQTSERENRTYFDVWTSFEARSLRGGAAAPYTVSLSDYRIEASVDPDLTLTAVTHVKVVPELGEVVAMPFEIAAGMSVTDASVDGRPAEVYQPDAMRANLAREGNGLFLVAPAEPLQAGRQYEFEFHHSGKVIQDAGDRVFYVSARGNWYPANGTEFANYDLQFRYPRDLELVTPGDIVEDHTDGDWRITRRRTPRPIRLAAFNLGDYAHVRVTRGPYTVEVYANRSLESALRPTPVSVIPQPSTTGLPRRMPRRPSVADQTEAVPVPPPPNPLARLQELADDVAGALEFMGSKFGPPALPVLTVSPIPGTFGQGFPGLIYLSTLSYLGSRTGPLAATNKEEVNIFYDEVLQAHETAHQWWGNVVDTRGYHDSWLMEALANYSALLFLEKHIGPRPAEVMLEDYRNTLLLKSDNGQTVDSAGPIVLGPRLESSQEPRAWRAITYGKGSWIIHMLRRRMGDERFFSMLTELRKRYEQKDITTDGFRLFAAQFLPPKAEDPKLEAFFDQWVYGTGIPSLKLSYNVKGNAPSLRLTGTLTQSDVDRDFSALVPVEIQLPRGQVITHWVASASDPVTFTVPLKEAPLKVLLDPHYAVLRR